MQHFSAVKLYVMVCNTMQWPMVCSAVVGKQGSAVKDLVPRIVGSTLELELEKKSLRADSEDAASERFSLFPFSTFLILCYISAKYFYIFPTEAGMSRGFWCHMLLIFLFYVIFQHIQARVPCFNHIFLPFSN